MKPYALAAKWNVPRNDVLKLLLHATQAGLVNKEWRLICPNCRVSESSSDKLATIVDRYHCDWCGIDYEGNV
ncbi:DUF5939 domain-containing protein [Paenibacillus baekrokdamisoli]|uniref:DUF5939 domain-containing protein n=1 Tax=Paenibacillus baekrokdamisoli TaxID=1712516 RepID=UPI001E338230|nr:DUF5939 domain-containing protein [Paenibacillus baekrokdamisoli]